MKSKISIFILSIISFFAGAQNVEEIVRKADEKMRGNSSEGEFTMIIERPTWSREISMKNWTLGNYYLLVYITVLNFFVLFFIPSIYRLFAENCQP